MSISTPTLRTTALILAAVVMLELLFPSGPDADAEEIASGIDNEVPAFHGDTHSPPLIGELPNMFERPLFYPDRRMPVAAVVEVAPPKPLELQLEGVAITPGQRVAVLRDANNRMFQLEEGHSHEGWTLDSVTSTVATFRRGSDVTELALDSGSGARRR
jgi:hypothetical protein